MLRASLSTDALRAELRELLGDIDAQIRSGHPVVGGELSRRVAVAEVSVVQALASLARQALVGAPLEADGRLTSQGQALDLRDGLAIAARDVRIERERLEGELATLQLLDWPQELAVAFQAQLDQEARVCGALEQAGAHARSRAAALKTIVADLSDVVLDALARAGRLPSADAQQRRRLGEEAYRQLEAAVREWLAWTGRLCEAERDVLARCEAVCIPRLLTDAAAHDAKTANFLGVIRQTMKLRRQQLRLLGLQQRLAAALAAGDVLASLQASIRF